MAVPELLVLEAGKARWPIRGAALLGRSSLRSRCGSIMRGYLRARWQFPLWFHAPDAQNYRCTALDLMCLVRGAMGRFLDRFRGRCWFGICGFHPNLIPRRWRLVCA